MKHLLLFMLLISAFSGCAVVPVGLIDSSTPLENTNGKHHPYKILGRAEGSHGAFSLFGFIPFGKADFELAMNDAVRKLNGDALINVRYWHRGSNYFVGTYSSLEVEGDVIKFVQE